MLNIRCIKYKKYIEIFIQYLITIINCSKFHNFINQKCAQIKKNKKLLSYYKDILIYDGNVLVMKLNIISLIIDMFQWYDKRFQKSIYKFNSNLIKIFIQWNYFKIKTLRNISDNKGQ